MQMDEKVFTMEPMLKPFSDTAYDPLSVVPVFEDIALLWEEVKKYDLPREGIINLASSVLEVFVKLNMDPKAGYHPVIYISEIGIYQAIMLDLDINYLRNHQENISFYSPHDVLANIIQ